MYERLGYNLQMVAAFLVLALTHYFASAFLPIADCGETFNFIEPIHYLLYGSGKQTGALRSWLFFWVYAWPAVFIRGAASLSSADAYFFLRIFNGRIAALAELFFVYSVWSAFSGKAAMVALLLLLVNYPIPHAAASVLPTSFAMLCNFVVLGCWLRTRSWTSTTVAKARTRGSGRGGGTPRGIHLFVGLALFFSTCGGVASWPFAGIVSLPIGLDLLFRFPAHAVLCMAGTAAVVIAAGLLVDDQHYCRWPLNEWSAVGCSTFGGIDRGPHSRDAEPWYFFWKHLALNFHLMFLAVLCAPLALLCTPRRSARLSSSSFTGRSVDAIQGDSAHRLASSEHERPRGHHPASPISPLTRSLLHPSGTPDRRSPHPSKAAGALTYGAPACGCSRGRGLLYMAPFFLWFAFWMPISQKEGHFMAPAYPFMVLAATQAICAAFFPHVNEECRVPTPVPLLSAGTTAATTAAGAAASPPFTRYPRAVAWRRAAGFVFLALFCLLSYSRAMAVYTNYSGVERILYDWYPVLRAEAQKRWAEKQAWAASGAAPPLRGTTPQQTTELNAYFTLCLGREWYRFPSSFFLDHRYARYQFLNTSHFHGMLPISFDTPAAGYEVGFLWAPHGRHHADAAKQRGGSSSWACGAEGANAQNCKVAGQFVPDPVLQCDAVFDSLSPPTHVSAAEHARERSQRHLDTVFTRSLLNTTAMRAVLAAEEERDHHVDDAYAVMDVDRTPLWCRVLYYPFGISKRCVAWRPLVLNAKP
ncbi:hypothetical protein ABL78_4589 [Leptomonas seymouri]|uniref:Mannosyltransferase n=1 Tax=Leptomonas seymouri TaxID=5684 RepID=A0A0N1I3C3_LEPSE|nr:hypothetical protein ABL78_4589 [Leptomonas seymouri]|eukprot:KPI86363.1 hypothetical protein ABL78_4589 [Leptomonas seymouri]